jgi:hypothetical protein
MTDTGPAHPRGASVGGRIVVAIGWLLVAGGIGLVVLQVVLGSLSLGGVILALFVSAAGAVPIAVGRGIEKSREH